MATLSIRIPKPKACLTVNGAIQFVGDWPLAQRMKKKFANMAGVELHSARHYIGLCYCHKCELPTKNPYLFTYEKHDYWTCECGKINFIN